MSNQAKIELDGKSYNLPTMVGSEGEKAIDITQLRNQTGHITIDDGYGNTGSCVSKVTFIDGDEGILRYRGIPIEQLAKESTFIETAYLLIYGELPNADQLRTFSNLLTGHQHLHEDMKYHFEGFPTGAHPMAILSSMINAASCFDDGLMNWQWGKTKQFEVYVAKLISQVRTIAAYSYRKSLGLPLIYPKKDYKYTENFLHMLFSMPYEDFELKPEVVKALDLIFLLHADHEQNCSTSTVRMVASSQANLFASCAAGVCALWGPLHGGANQAVLEMLADIHKSGDDGSKFITAAKDKNSGKKLMGFGHRVYKNHDPRAKIIKKACDDVLGKLHISDPLLDIA
ncbi:MAG TPA: citrate/2-methylcitrate synthase, partial [Verrucomicrobiae bacterium]